MAWADDLPRIRAENEAWRAKFGPALAERDRLKRERRERVSSIIARGLDAIAASASEREDVFLLTGFGGTAEGERGDG